MKLSLSWGREARFDDPHAIARYDNVSLVVADTRNIALRRVHFRGPRFGHVETLAKFSSNDLNCPILAADTMAIGVKTTLEAHTSVPETRQNRRTRDRETG